MKSWLKDKGSFMQRLEAFGVHDAKVRVIEEGWGCALPEEVLDLKISPDAKVWIREVIIQSDDKIWMVAKSVFPRETLTDEYKNLKNRSLGSVIFKDKNLQRSDFKFFDLQSNLNLYEKIKKTVKVVNQKLSCRSSVFTSHGKDIYLMEVFFPAISELE